MELETVYQEYSTMVYKFLMTLTGNAQLSEELTQETFYQAVKSAASFDGSCKVSTWLCQIAKHLWLQELERQKRKGSTVELDETIESSHKTPIEQVIAADEKLAVYKVIHILKGNAKEVVLLRLNGEFSFKEIGEIFGKTENWARVTYYRAKQKIMEGMSRNERT